MATVHLLRKLILFGVMSCFANAIWAKPFYGFGQEVDSYISIAAKRYGVSEEMLRGLVKMEDGWTGKLSFTGATGVGQFTMGTWNWLATTERGQQIGMKQVTSRNRNTSADPRRHKYTNTLATALLVRWHIEQFSSRGIPQTDGNLYMAHNIGLDGLHRALLGRSTREDILNMKRNGMKSWMSVKDFLAYQKDRYYTHKREANVGHPSLPNSEIEFASNHKVKPKSPTYANPTQSTSPIVSAYLKADPSVNWVQPTERVVWVMPQ